MHEVVLATPSVFPARNFHPREDALLLKTTIQGIIIDAKEVINILTKRNLHQRLEIARQYNVLCGSELIDDLGYKTFGNFSKTLKALLTPKITFYAKELNNAIVGLGTDERALIDILCTLTNSEMKAVKMEYKKQYKRSLYDDIVDDTSGQFKTLLIHLLNASRDENHNTDDGDAFEDAIELYKAGGDRIGTDPNKFLQVLTSRNFNQLSRILKKYVIVSAHTIEEAIEEEFSGDVKDGLLTIVKLVEDKNAYFAERLYQSMKGLGTNDATLIRTMVSRSEIDLGDIEVKFFKLYNKRLARWIIDDCSGNYKRCLLALLDRNISFDASEGDL